MSNSKYWQPQRLLTMRDINGELPGIYMVQGNRTAGKSFGFKALLVKRFLEGKGKFACIVRTLGQINDYGESFFKDLEEISFPGYSMTSKIVSNTFAELYLDKESCGYVLPLNQANKIKLVSSRFVDANWLFFDEFQPESASEYVADEITKFQSIHTSVARGGGKQTRYVPVYMCSNAVSLINPYFASLGVSTRYKSGAKFIRGDGWVLEITVNKAAQEAQKSDPFSRAFSATNYQSYAADNQYLLDNTCFIQKLDGPKELIVVLGYNGNKYGVWECRGLGLTYVSRQYDDNFPWQIVFQQADHSPNFTMMRKNSQFAKYLQQTFESGYMRFQDLSCQEMMLQYLGFSTIK